METRFQICSDMMSTKVEFWPNLTGNLNVYELDHFIISQEGSDIMSGKVGFGLDTWAK